jgi:sterol desaturase/sphingolipid hydroxylase (fatty acid hydroxylase superfamily)
MWIQDLFERAQQGLFETAIQPIMYSFGFAHFLEDGYTATGWLLVGLIQIAVLLAIIGPLQRWRPVEPLVDAASAHRHPLHAAAPAGAVPGGLFFSVEPLFDDLFGMLRVAGFGTWHLDQLAAGFTDHPFASFLLYLVVFDFVDYWIHRGQHSLNWWWSLHSLHHSQRQMTMWSDNRNHLLDDLIRDSALVVLGQLIGVGPGQFVAIVAVAQLSESLQHANLRLHFGRIGERLWISPRFHRRTTASASATRTSRRALKRNGRSRALGGHNFGVLLPWWDMLFRTANFELRYDPTGVRDQVEKGRDYGKGFWSQQWLGLLRLVGKA